MEFSSPEALCEFIKNKHEEYINHKRMDVELDIHNIVPVNHQVIKSINQFFKDDIETIREKHKKTG